MKTLGADREIKDPKFGGQLNTADKSYIMSIFSAGI